MDLSCISQPLAFSGTRWLYPAFLTLTSCHNKSSLSGSRSQQALRPTNGTRTEVKVLRLLGSGNDDELPVADSPLLIHLAILNTAIPVLLCHPIGTAQRKKDSYQKVIEVTCSWFRVFVSFYKAACFLEIKNCFRGAKQIR